MEMKTFEHLSILLAIDQQNVHQAKHTHWVVNKVDGIEPSSKLDPHLKIFKSYIFQ